MERAHVAAFARAVAAAVMDGLMASPHSDGVRHHARGGRHLEMNLESGPSSKCVRETDFGVGVGTCGHPHVREACCEGMGCCLRGRGNCMWASRMCE